MLRDNAPAGAPCWVEVFTSDPERTREFYGELFGWKSESAGEEYGGYVKFSKDDVLVAGCMRNDGRSGAVDTWSVYLAVENAPATVDAATAAGAQVIVPPMPVMELGTMAVVTDPGQAAIGMWQPGLHRGFGVLGEPGAPAWFELYAQDYDATVDFYRRVFGWDTHVASDVPEFRYTTFGAEDHALAGIMDGAAMLPAGASGRWAVYFGVEDTDAALARVEQLGGAVVAAAQDSPHGRLAEATDPTGAAFKLVAAG